MPCSITTHSSSLTTESFQQLSSLKVLLFSLHLSHTRIMTQVCSILKCSAVITIQEGQEAVIHDKTVCAKCYGKPICAKCDRVLHAQIPIIPVTQIVPYTYEGPDYGTEVIHTYLPKPKPGYVIRREEFFDGDGNMRYEYVSHRVRPAKRRTHARLVKRVKRFFRCIQRGSQ